MTKYISIDPGKCKCGLIFADVEEKKILEAIVIDSRVLVKNIKRLREHDQTVKVIIGNGTTSKYHSDSLSFLGSNLIIVEEKNTTFRAKKRYFEIYPVFGIKRLFPKDFFLININLDAISALIILEDHLNLQFTLNMQNKSKTWMKQ